MTYRCEGCSNAQTPKELYVCANEAHEEHTYLLCISCYDAHCFTQQRQNGSHYPETKWLH